MGSSQPFRPDSYRNPDGVRKEAGSGSGSAVGGKKPPRRARHPGDLNADLRRAEDAHGRRLAWAADHLPDEEPIYVAAAFGVVEIAVKREPTAEEVMQRLQVRGQTREQLNPGGSK